MALPVNKLERGVEMLKRNPLAFKAAVHQNFGIKSRRASKESDCLRSKKFNLIEELLKEIIASGCFSDVQEKKFELRENDIKRLVAELKQCHFIQLFAQIGEILNERMHEMLSRFDFKGSKILKNAPVEFIEAIKFRIKDGLENISNRFKAFSEIAFVLSSENNVNPLKILENCKKVIKGNKHILKNLSGLRFDFANHLTKIMIDIGTQEKGKHANEYFKLHTQKIDGQEETFVTPTQKLYERLVNEYPYPDTSAVEADSPNQPTVAHGCPAAYVFFDNNKNMISTFLEWFEQVTEKCFFEPIERMISTNS